MSFETIEESTSDGRPVELLQITYGLTGVWCYTTAEQVIEYDARTYSPIAMKRDAIATTGDASRSSLSISVPQDTPVGELFRVQPPSGLVIVTLFGHHFEDDGFTVLWKGRITNVEWNPPWLKLTVENVFSSLQRPGLRRRYSTQCPFALYGAGCNVNRDAFKVEMAVDVISGNTVTSPNAVGFDDNYFAGGYLEWEHSVRETIERRMIRTSNGTTGVLTLVSAPEGLAVDSVAFGFPGCDHLIATCDGKFDNSENYGGFPYFPKKNPFGGSMIY